MRNRMYLSPEDPPPSGGGTTPPAYQPPPIPTRDPEADKLRAQVAEMEKQRAVDEAARKAREEAEAGMTEREKAAAQRAREELQREQDAKREKAEREAAKEREKAEKSAAERVAELERELAKREKAAAAELASAREREAALNKRLLDDAIAARVGDIRKPEYMRMLPDGLALDEAGRLSEDSVRALDQFRADFPDLFGKSDGSGTTPRGKGAQRDSVVPAEITSLLARMRKSTMDVPDGHPYASVVGFAAPIPKFGGSK